MAMKNGPSNQEESELPSESTETSCKTSKLERLRFWSKSQEHLLHFANVNSVFNWKRISLRRVLSDRKNSAPVGQMARRSASMDLEGATTVSPVPRRRRPSNLKLNVKSRLKSFISGPEFRVRSLESLFKSTRHQSQDTHASKVQMSSTPGKGSSRSLASFTESVGFRPLSGLKKTVDQQEERLQHSRLTAIDSSCSSLYEFCHISLDTPGSLRASKQLLMPIDDEIESDANIICPEPPAGVKIIAKRLLGHGANGICHEVSIQPTEEILRYGQLGFPERAALKVLPINTYQTKTAAIHREIKIQRQMIHPNLLGLFAAYHDTRLRAVCLLLEFCAIGTLMDLIAGGKSSYQVPSSRNQSGDNLKSPRSALKQPESLGTWNRLIHDPNTGGLPISLAKLIFRGLMRGLSYLHDTYGIVHRDIKPTNILIADGFVAKLSDFGMACRETQCVQQKNQICGTPNYLAPEVFLKEGHSRASDCWASGATLYYMLCGRPPFQPHQLTGSVCQKSPMLKPDEARTGEEMTRPPDHKSGLQVRSICRNVLWGRYEFPKKLHQIARHTIVRLLQRRPGDRPSAAEVLSMDFCSANIRDMQRSVRIIEHQKLDQTEVNHSIQPCADKWKMNAPGETKTNNGTSQSRPSGCPVVQIVTPEEETSEDLTIGEFVQTGDEAIYDAFRLLSGRAKERYSSEANGTLFHWVSRWALTSSLLLYYTLGSISLNRTKGGPEQNLANENETSTKLESWGVTSRNGQGLVKHKEKLIQFEPNTSRTTEETIKLPDPGDVKTNCEFLVRQLKDFAPLSSQDGPTTQQGITEQEHPISSTPAVFIQRWKDHGNNLIFSFSTGGWQVNFYDHSKLIVHYPNTMVYTDAAIPSSNRSFSTFCHVSQTTGDLEEEIRRWIANHTHLKNILQILLFTIL